MKNEVIEFPQPKDTGSSLPVTREAVDKMRQQRELLREYVKSQLREDVDYGTVPGTQKHSLYKPGAEKLRQLFRLGSTMSMTDKELDRKDNFAMYTYKCRIYPIEATDLTVSECEGSCNSQEKKYRERTIYEWVDMTRQDGSIYRKKVDKGTEPTPVCDVLNTLQKMAQKRAFVGAVIMATGASDFFTQDIDDPEDAAQLGIHPRQEPQRAAVAIPKATSAASQHQAQPSASQATGEQVPNCELCGTQMRLSKAGDAFTCPNWKDKSKGDHSYVRR